MENLVELSCPHCGAVTTASVEERAAEAAAVRCGNCGRPVATVGQLHAEIAQQALGLGATDLRDDHVPVDGELGERPGV